MYIAQIASGAATLVEDCGRGLTSSLSDRFGSQDGGETRFVSKPPKAANDSRFPNVDDIADRLNKHIEISGSVSKTSK